MAASVGHLAGELQVHCCLGFTTLPSTDLGCDIDNQILVASEATGQSGMCSQETFCKGLTLHCPQARWLIRSLPGISASLIGAEPRGGRKADFSLPGPLKHIKTRTQALT